MTRRSSVLVALTLLFALGGFVLVGCAPLANITPLRDRIESAGYERVQIDYNVTNRFVTLTVDVHTVAPRAAEESDFREISTIVWRTYPHDINELRISVNESSSTTLSAEELEGNLGPRPAGLIQQDNTVLVVLIVAAFAVLLIIVVAVIVLVVVLRRQKRRAQQPGQHRQQPPPGYWVSPSPYPGQPQYPPPYPPPHSYPPQHQWQHPQPSPSPYQGQYPTPPAWTPPAQSSAGQLPEQPPAGQPASGQAEADRQSPDQPPSEEQPPPGQQSPPGEQSPSEEQPPPGQSPEGQRASGESR